MKMRCDDCGCDFQDGDDCFVFNLSIKGIETEIILCPDCVENAMTEAYSDESELYADYIERQINEDIEREHRYDI